jgi:multidrug resistance efflux pump
MLHTPQAPAPAAPPPSAASPPTRGRHLPASPRRLVGALALLLLVAGLTVWLLVRSATSAEGPLVASGTLEVEEVTLAAQAPGQVAELRVDEGDAVQAAQLLGRLADPVLEVQSRQATIDPAQQQLTRAQLEKLELRAPIYGVVQKRLVHRGEFVALGAPLLTVADPTDLKLTVYVREADLGRVFVNQAVAIQSDAFPAQSFGGRVSTIASRAEFTPRNVQTQHDRQNLVFAVTVRVPNPSGALKAGLPADATFSTSSSQP